MCLCERESQAGERKRKKKPVRGRERNVKISQIEERRERKEAVTFGLFRWVS